jgi:hypothetical protein
VGKARQEREGTYVREIITANNPMMSAYTSGPARPAKAVEPPKPPAELDFHPAAGIFPMLEQVELEALAEDIKTNGLQVPIVLYQGKILDGRNRYLACKLAGVAVNSTQYLGNTPTAYVFSLNEKRRHLTPSQRAALAVEALPEYSKAAKTRQRLGVVPAGANLQKGKAAELAARDFKASSRCVEKAKAVQEKSPETFAKVKSGEVTVNKAVAQLAPPKPKSKRPGKLVHCPHCGQDFRL